MTHALPRLKADGSWKGIAAPVLERAGVHERDGLLVVPYRLRDGTLFRERFFTPDGRTWWGSGDDLIPFGLELANDPRGRMLIIAEGESDTLAVREMFGSEVDVLGLPGANTWRPDWSVHLRGYAVVFVAGDGDPAGCRMIERVLADVPDARAVLLPEGEDCRSILQCEGPRALDRYLADAERRHLLYLAFLNARSLAELEATLAGEAAA